MNKRASIPPQSLTELAYAHLEELIVTLKLAPGAAVSEGELSARTGIGRTPIREASAAPGARAAGRDPAAPRHRRLPDQREGAAEAPGSAPRAGALHRAKRRAARHRGGAQALPRAGARLREVRKSDDDVTFMRTDREFNTLCSAASHNDFAASAMSLMHSLSRRFWYIHYKQAADMPLTAKLHATSRAPSPTATRSAPPGRATSCWTPSRNSRTTPSAPT
jgi:hypothetical protein